MDGSLLKKIFSRIYVLLLVSTIVSCKTQNLFSKTSSIPGKPLKVEYASKEDSLAFSVDENYEYKIRTDDKLTVSIWDHDDLSIGSLYGIYNSNEVYGKWAIVNKAGQINLPKVGPFKIKGMTILQAEDTLRKTYREWIKNPVVNVKVLNKEVTVIGELKTPGNYLLEKENNSLMEVLAKAGDMDFYANKKKIKVIRMVDNQPRMVSIDLTVMDDYLARNIKIIPGDLIIVPSKKGKDFDKRISTILPFVSIITAFAITYGTFF